MSDTRKAACDGSEPINAVGEEDNSLELSLRLGLEKTGDEECYYMDLDRAIDSDVEEMSKKHIHSTPKECICVHPPPRRLNTDDFGEDASDYDSGEGLSSASAPSGSCQSTPNRFQNRDPNARIRSAVSSPWSVL